MTRLLVALIATLALVSCSVDPMTEAEITAAANIDTVESAVCPDPYEYCQGLGLEFFDGAYNVNGFRWLPSGTELVSSGCNYGTQYGDYWISTSYGTKCQAYGYWEGAWVNDHLAYMGICNAWIRCGHFL